MGLWIVWRLKQDDFHIKFAGEIAEWKKYQDQKRFAKLITKVIQKEMAKFHITHDEIVKIVEKMTAKPTFTITVVDSLR